MDYVILEVLYCLQHRNDDNEYFVFVAPGADRCLTSTERMHVLELRCPTYLLWEQWILPRAVRKAKVELLHCTSNTAPLHCTVPLILTLHDIIYLTEKKGNSRSFYQLLGWYYRRWNVPRIIDRCKQIITVSETARTNILNHFPQSGSRLTVVYNGCSNCYHPLSIEETRNITRKYLPDNHYLLFFGNTDPRKNTIGVLRAYNDYLHQSAHPLKLVITGLKRDYVEDLLVELNIEICASNLVYTGYIPSQDLPALYNGASVFLFPSLKEGFGIPVIEAMACATPVITSNCSSLPEVAGEEALMVSPKNPKEIAESLIRLENDEDFRKKQIAYGLKRAKLFSWENTADKYTKLYRL